MTNRAFLADPKASLVSAMVKPVGSATEEDSLAVACEICKLPEVELQMLHELAVGVRVCREAVTDYRTDLKNQAPRGWPVGVDWTSVPGCYCPDEKNIIIATIHASGTGRVVPPKGVKHGAFNLVIHETMHADDYIVGRLRSNNAAFLSARAEDLEALSDYEAQEGQAGYEETYAETAAHFFGGDPMFGQTHPRLAEFWRTVEMPVRPGNIAPRMDGRLDNAIGSATRRSNGTIVLDLRAEGPDVALGHAMIAVAHGSPTYAAIHPRLPVTAETGTIRRSPAGGRRQTVVTSLLAPF